MMKCMSTSWEAVKYYVMGLFCKGVTPPPAFDEFYGFGGKGMFHEKKLLLFWIFPNEGGEPCPNFLSH